MTPSFRSTFMLAVLFSGIALIYAIGVSSRSIWFDEAITLQSLAGAAFHGVEPGAVQIAELRPYVEGTTTVSGLLRHYIETDIHPPLYFLLAHAATLVFGNDLMVVRGVSLVLVLVSAGLYMNMLRRTGSAAPLLMMLVYGLSFTAVSTAQDARGYALLLPLAIGAWHLLAVMPDLSGRRRLGGEALLGGLCAGLMLTHYFAVLLVLAMFGWHLLDGLRRRRAIALIAPLACTLLFLPWLPVLFDHLGARPGQMQGFAGLVEWLKRGAHLMAGQVFSASHFAVSSQVQTIGRVAVLGLATLGALAALRRPSTGAERDRLALIAVVVPALGLTGFLAMSVLLDRWFDALRYFVMFAPFMAYLAGRGALELGRTLFADRAWRLAPALLLVASEAAMANYGWEANRNRGGSYLNSIAAQVAARPAGDTLVLIDMGSGRGTPLEAAYALPPDTGAYLLDSDPQGWGAAAADIAPRLDGVSQVLLLYTIERGSMESDKAQLYKEIVEMLEADGFDRTAAAPADQGRRYYARWSRGG